MNKKNLPDLEAMLVSVDQIISNSENSDFPAAYALMRTFLPDEFQSLSLRQLVAIDHQIQSEFRENGFDFNSVDDLSRIFLRDMREVRRLLIEILNHIN